MTRVVRLRDRSRYLSTQTTSATLLVALGRIDSLLQALENLLTPVNTDLVCDLTISDIEDSCADIAKHIAMNRGCMLPGDTTSDLPVNLKTAASVHRSIFPLN